VPTTVPFGAFMLALNWKSGAVNQGASFTSTTLSTHEAEAVSGAPSIPASVARTVTTKLGVSSKSKAKADVAAKL
jgi:hypothetical protein